MGSLLAAASFAAALLLPPAMGKAQVIIGEEPVPEALSPALLPPIAGIESYILDNDAAVRLGKALFWDMQAGSDAVQACATCHFHAGADNRAKNQLHPGFTGIFKLVRPNGLLTAEDYPFHRVKDVNKRTDVIYDTGNIGGSQGLVQALFENLPDTPSYGVPPGQEGFVLVEQSEFSIGGTSIRQVTGRNAPTIINAGFLHSAFWDGRARNIFNGVNSFGEDDPDARVLKNVEGVPTEVQVNLANCTLASQALSPMVSPVEMSFSGRTIPDVGRKLLPLKPLAGQIVDPLDSALGNDSDFPDTGLRGLTYRDMIQAAFQPEWWNLGDFQMEHNFSLFFGLAIQAYERTLVSDDTPFDRWRRGIAPNALSAQAIQGLNIFLNQGQCIACHVGPDFTSASVVGLVQDQIENGVDPDFDVNNPVLLTEVMAMRDFHQARYDIGFYNIGVRPTEEDLGRGAVNPMGKPISHSKRIDPARAAVDGAFKTPSLRNVELTGPYFHNGGAATLMQVVDFYARGSDFFEHNKFFLSPEIGPGADGTIFSLTSSESNKEALVAFLLSLTDDRVRFERAPFDHPQLFVPDGVPGDSQSVDCTLNQILTGTCIALIEIPATGMLGRPLNGNQPDPLRPYLGLDPRERGPNLRPLAKITPSLFLLLGE